MDKTEFDQIKEKDGKKGIFYLPILSDLRDPFSATLI